ncbi:MAG TPA: hypothetical protein VFS21_05795 [Roseiflexaceae bacterium]|nr:hypothetical protein [Roseiflexaceae bacterium]
MSDPAVSQADNRQLLLTTLQDVLRSMQAEQRPRAAQDQDALLLSWDFSAGEGGGQRHPHFNELRPGAGEPPTNGHVGAPRSPFREALLSDLCALAVQQRILLVQPHPDLPAGDLLRALARRLLVFLHMRAGDDAARPAVAALEYSPQEPASERDETPFDLEQTLRKLTSPTILLFPQASRQQLGWDLDALERMPTPHPYYILACADTVGRGWNFLPDEERFWTELPTDDLFEPAYLAHLLREGLARRQTRLPARLQGKLDPDAPLLGDWTLREVAVRLRSPAAIGALLHALTRLPETAGLDDLRSLVGEYARLDARALLERWYYGQLTRREQLLAIGATLLEGVQESQLFAALQDLLEVWQQQDAGAILDYIDLEQLLIFFELREVAPYDVRLESRLSGQRELLLELALRSHRRHLRRALPWLARLIARSYARDAAHDELLGAPQQRARLREVLSDSLSDIALHAPDLAQPAILWLVAQADQDNAHLALARSLARWSPLGRTEELLRLLGQWRGDQRHRAFVQRLQGDTRGKQADTAEALLHGVSLLTICYAVRAAAPGRVDERLLAALREQIGDNSRRVRLYVRDYLLPMLTAQHTSQISPVLQDLAQRTDLRSAISTRLATVYRTRPREITKLIQQWYEQGDLELAPRAKGSQRRRAEALLATVALTLGGLPFEPIYPIKLDVARRMQREILNIVHDREARIEVWTACFYLSSNDAAALHALLEQVEDDEEDRIVEWLTKTFLDQRAQLGGQHDAVMQTPNGSFPIWLTRRPPETEVERTLLDALARTRDPLLRRLAFHAFVSFVERFDVQEERFVAAELQRRAALAAGYPAPPAPVAPAPAPDTSGPAPAGDGSPAAPPEPDFYRDVLIPRLVLLDDPEHYEEIIQDVLPLARTLQRQSPQVLDRLLQRLQRDDTNDLGLIAVRLGEVLDLEALPRQRVLLAHPGEVVRTLYDLWREQGLPPALTRAALGLAALLVLLPILVCVLLVRG